jgi:hypothetical protein
MGGQSRRGTLLWLGGAAAIVALAAAGLSYAAGVAKENANQAAGRLGEVKTLAGEYESAKASAMRLSADVDDARSSVFINNALRQNGVTELQEIAYGEPKELPGALEMRKTTIKCSNVRLMGVVGFLREMETGRDNLALLDAELTRQNSPADSWQMDLDYGALIQAKSRM